MSQQEMIGAAPLTIAPAVSPTKPHTQADSGRPHPEAVFLEVPVKIHGSRVLAVVRGITPHTEPFEEQTVTMIVFPGGGVVRMRTAMHAEQAVVLSNLKSGQDAIGRVSRVRPCGNQQMYVEVEFATAQPGFWGVEFLSERSEVEAKAGPAAPPVVSGTAALNAPPLARAAAPIAEAPTEEKVTSAVDPAPVNSAISAAATSLAAGTFSSAPPAASSATARSVRPASAFVSIGESEEVQPAATENFGQRRDRRTKNETATVMAWAPPVEAPAAAESSPEDPPSSPGTSEGAGSVGRTRAASSDASAGFGARSAFGTFAGAGQSEEPRRSWVWIVICAALLLAAAGGGGAYWVNEQLAAEPPAIPVPVAPALPAEITTGRDLAGPTIAQANAGNSTVNTAESSRADAAPSAGAPVAGGSAAIPAHANQLPQPKAGAARPDVSGTVNARPVASREAKATENTPGLPMEAGPVRGGRGGVAPAAGGSPEVAPRASQALALDSGVWVKAPRVISETKPAYPAAARQAGVEGSVVVRMLIDKEGNVVDAKALAGPETLRGAAVDAARQWKYEPSILNGQPVSVQMPVTIPFRR